MKSFNQNNYLVYSHSFFFWLHWVFVDVHRLSLAAASWDYSLLRCAGFLLWWLLVAEHGL